jgi:hypothetical protein
MHSFNGEVIWKIYKRDSIVIWTFNMELLLARLIGWLIVILLLFWCFWTYRKIFIIICIYWLDFHVSIDRKFVNIKIIFKCVWCEVVFCKLWLVGCQLVSYFVVSWLFDLIILTEVVSPLLTSTNPQKFITGWLELITARNLSIWNARK